MNPNAKQGIPMNYRETHSESRIIINVFLTLSQTPLFFMQSLYESFSAWFMPTANGATL
jgi:hypothetical protein